jgi:hypothetical protein
VTAVVEAVAKKLTCSFLGGDIYKILPSAAGRREQPSLAATLRLSTRSRGRSLGAVEGVQSEDRLVRVVQRALTKKSASTRFSRLAGVGDGKAPVNEGHREKLPSRRW